MIQNFQKKLKKIPEEVQNILLSDFGYELESEIYNKYRLPEEKRYLIGEMVSMIFLKELLLKDLVGFLMNNFSIKEKIAQKIALDIIGERILIIKDYFKDENIQKYFKDLGGNIKDYENTIITWHKELKKELADEDISKEKGPKIIEKKNKEFDPEQEKKDSIQVFSSMLRYLLLEHVNFYLKNYNLSLIFLLEEDQNFKKDLEKALYQNAELLTHASFESEGKALSPTIGNWIQDFIKSYGTDYANNLLITKYITESKNAKLLNPEEKKIVQKLLQLYRNLKFFPDAFSDLPPERWEIIPVEKSGADDDQIEKKLSIPKTKAEKEIDTLAHEEENYKEGGLERLAIQEEIDKKKRIEDLQIEINKYKENSLERRALEEELKKIKD